jgi:hypothetical protein
LVRYSLVATLFDCVQLITNFSGRPASIAGQSFDRHAGNRKQFAMIERCRPVHAPTKSKADKGSFADSCGHLKMAIVGS